MTTKERLENLAKEIKVAREAMLKNVIDAASGKSMQKSVDYYSGYHEALCEMTKLVNSALIAEYLKK